MKGIRYEHQAAAAADTARALWRRADDVISMLEWTLARDDKSGLPLFPGSPLRLVVFPAAKSVGMPHVECVFSSDAHCVTIHDMEFS